MGVTIDEMVTWLARRLDIDKASAATLIMINYEGNRESLNLLRKRRLIGWVFDKPVPLDEVAGLMIGGDDSKSLAAGMKELFPKGYKEGTNQRWTDGVLAIENRLITFKKIYGNNWTNDEILDATRRYVESFDEDYRYMRTLKYFIVKQESVGGKHETQSDLYNFLIDPERTSEYESDVNWGTMV